MFLHVRQAKHVGAYKVELLFNDDRLGVADLSAALRGPMFEPLRDLELFAQLRVDDELETVVWPNGADLAPEYLYFLAFKDDPELQPKFLEWGYLVPAKA